jgi:hypothetical protein
VLTVFAKYQLESPGLATGITVVWLIIVAYTWFGPTVFLQRLREEIRSVEIHDF